DRVLEVNPVAVQLTGFHADELVGISSGVLFRYEYEANQVQGHKRLRGAFTETVVFHGQDGYLLRSKQGWIPVTLTVSRLHLAERTLGLLVARDDRERRETLRQLRQVEAELRSVLAHSPAALWSAERVREQGKSHWRFRYISPALGRLIGRPVESFRQLFQWLEAVHPDDRSACDNWLKQLFSSTATAGEHQYRICTPQGEVRWVRDRLQIVRDETGRAIRLDGCLTDITELQQATAELAQQHSLLSSLLASAPDLICYKDRELRYLGGNTSFAQFAGRPIDQIRGLRCEDVFQLPADLLERRRQIEQRVLETGETIRSREAVPWKAGEPPLLLDIVVAPLRSDPEMPPAGVLMVARDVTEQARLEEQLRQSQKLEALGQLAGGIAHDFNNLLTVILGNLELVLSQGSEGLSQRSCLEAAAHAARQAANLTRQMLGFARRQPLQSIRIDLNALIHEEIQLLRHSIDPRIGIHFQPAEEAVFIRGDPVQIQQVLMNLCLNARDAMPEGGTLTIATALVPPAALPAPFNPSVSTRSYVRLSVIDTGCGMTEEVKSRIFDPFFTTKEIGKGTGLGLAVVYGVVRAHEGWIDCQSAPGKGTRFDVYLPCLDSQAEMTGVPPVAAETVGMPEALERYESILVVDDEPFVRAVAVAALQQAGYCVLAAEDGQQAVELFQQAADRIDLIVLDASMPRLCGRDAYRQLRQIHPTVPILFASGHFGTELPTDQPHTAFIHKPYTPAALVKAVQQMLGHSGTTQRPVEETPDSSVPSPPGMTPPPSSRLRFPMRN
ncbi:MAG: PAS domain S-box protein, partial [Gemmataceae bacterium]|nr:PAS domain S-box protein [Gemmataceae bacterium]